MPWFDDEIHCTIKVARILFYFFGQRQEERALTDDGLAVCLEHGPAHNASATDDQIREEPTRLLKDEKRQVRD
jgi:hypothetical protein